ncbi:tyrosine-specific protein phosphatase, putative [Marinomonas sp. MED121]|uniref:dual specificity protein phosphatase family protein n=1 Tax=Marinomonas sp. MED121 TaxID=314277 RepID=UPI00006910FB|nr:dual specificity protein phosphatase family protein [Marinomonas sp. MED121]EAQ67763.1 tyrosine-specific protein phosphatase, putative [Marinomonas sp. MED121]
MKHVFWLIEGKIAGRSGPNLDTWNLAELKEQGIAAILSVNFSESVDSREMEGAGIAHANIPMSPNAPVQLGDKETCLANLPKAMAFIKAQKAAGPVMIHCRSGKDRTGLVMAAYLVQFEGMTAKEAMDKVFSVRSIAFSAEGWIPFALDVLESFEINLRHERCQA